MDHQKKTILILVLSCAGLLLLLLYSPWGSPDLYTKKIYFAENQGVNFKDCGIKNAYKGESGLSNSENPDLTVKDYYAERKKQIHYNPNTSTPSTSTITTNKIIAINTSTKPRSNLNNRVNLTHSVGGTRNAGSSGSSEVASFATFSSNRGKVDSSVPTNNFTTTSVDLSLFGDSTALLASNTAQKADRLDPGDDLLDGEPIPISDGWSFLIFMAAVYCGYIFFKNIKTRLTTAAE